jgi:tetratricopeptide (TPR) repeat protein
MDRHRYRDPTLSYAILAVPAEQFADAERLFTGILNSAERRCEPLALLQAAMGWIDSLCRLGRLNEALAAVDVLAELAELFPHGAPLTITYQALVFLELGDLEQAERCCVRLPTKLHQEQYSLHRTDGWQLHLRGVLAHRQGQSETACALFTQLEEWADRTGEADPSFVPWAADAVAAYLACDRETDARHVIDWVAQRAVSLPTVWPKIVVTTGQAALAERAGDPARAESYFDYGTFLTRTGDRVRARALLGEAMHIAGSCGARWHTDRARAGWRRAGGRTRTHKVGTG